MKRKLLSIFITVATFVCLFAFSAQAAETVDVTVYGTYNYSYANKVLSIINEERAKQGLAALEMDPNLTEYAMQRAAEISVYYDHTRPDGRNFDTVVTDSTYKGAKGENIALGQTGPEDVMTSWMNSKGHRENILKTDYKTVGIGCYRQDNGKYCWVQLFSTDNKGYSYSKSGTVNKTTIPISIKPELVQLYISGLSGGDTRITNSNNGDVTASLFYGKTTPVTLKLKNASEKLTTDVKTALSGGYTFASGNSSLIGVNASGFIARAKGVTTMSFSLDNLYSGSFPVGVFDEVKLNVDGIYHQTRQMVNISWDNSSGAANLLLYQYPDSGNMWYEQTNVGSNKAPSLDVILTAGEKRIYRIFTLVNSATGQVFPVSDPVTVTAVTYPENIVVNTVISSGKPKISWDKVDGAVKYIILRDLETISTSTGTSFVDKTAEIGKTYKYQVLSENEFGCRSVSGGSYGPATKGTAILPAPDVTVTNVASTGKVKLSWNAVDGATSYIVYRSTNGNDGSWGKATTSKTSYINTSAQAGVKYYYKVQAVHSDPDLSSKPSASVIRSCDLPQPEVTIGNVKSTGKIKLSWNAVPGAAKYEIYRSTTKTGSYTKMLTTKGTSYVNTSANAGTLYYYKVKAIHSTNSGANSAYSAVLNRRCDLEQPVLTASNVKSTGKIKLSWNAVPGASKYELYRATSKNGTYKLYKTTTNTSFVNTSTTVGAGYYYKLKAIHKNSAANSAFSETKLRTCDLPRPAVTVSYTSKGKPKLTWNAVSGATKYEVWRCETKNGTYKKVGTISGTTAVHDIATSGKTYYYKVRAIHSNSAANSAYSLIVSATAK